MKKLLVVEDDPLIRQSVALALQAQGFHVATAEDGSAALKQLGTDQVDGIVCDIAMPSMDGIELCRTLRLDARTARIPFLFLSAYQGIEDRLQGLSVGADDFLGKPFSLEELVYRINRLLTNQQQPLVNDSLDVNPNHLGQVSFEQALDLICSHQLSGLLNVILSDNAVGQVWFEDGRSVAAKLESASGETLLEASAALEHILRAPPPFQLFSGQQTLDNAVLVSRITRIVESEFVRG
ncbi:MAG: response regulator [Chloracidobacterium sp.]